MEINAKVLRYENEPYYRTVEVYDAIIYLCFKRGLDILGSLFGIIILSPLMVIIAALIKLDSKGPVLFKQTRVGLEGRKFTMYKFRSMVINAEELLRNLGDKNEMKGPVFKIKKDPRITSIGCFIRRTSLDELPQLFNVLRGNMSLVGPRPPLPREVIQYNGYQKQRLMVKPGITCIWQISGRNNISFDEWMDMDIQYISERSLWVDIKIILKTIIVVLKADGAY